MSSKQPVHPGLTVKHDCLEPLGLTITDGAKALGVSRLTLSNIVNGKTGISPEMAIRLEKMGWSNADMWLRMQQAHDLALARRRQSRIKVAGLSGVKSQRTARASAKRARQAA